MGNIRIELNRQKEEGSEKDGINGTRGPDDRPSIPVELHAILYILIEFSVNKNVYFFDSPIGKLSSINLLTAFAK